MEMQYEGKMSGDCYPEAMKSPVKAKDHPGSRKRLYGDEYQIAEPLVAPPQAKNIRLEQPKFEEAVVQLYNQSHQQSVSTLDKNMSNQMIPTPTPRPYERLAICIRDIPKLCPTCYSIKCICSLLTNKQSIH
ncbi:GbNV_gp39-like [Fopius arisanus]|nr:GbNV_gp39-like [Fopius arisanus]